MSDFLNALFRLWLPCGLVVAAWAGCAALENEARSCDPGYVAAKLQAMAIECNGERRRLCAGVTQAEYDDDTATCPAVTACYAELDREVGRCVGR